jgi:hypothetical protein
MPLPPDDVLRGALRVLFIGGVYTRNWTLNEDVSRKQINDLWEALHEIPDLLTRWRDDSERELAMYLRASTRRSGLSLTSRLRTTMGWRGRGSRVGAG